MYHLTIRDHFMIAHSFSGEIFGPAQKLHGATYIVDVTLYRERLDADDLVIDIGAASVVLSEVLQEFNFSNLDDYKDFEGHNTTTEFMAGVIFGRMKQAVGDGRLGPGAQGLTRMEVTLSESNIARAGFEADL